MHCKIKVFNYYVSDIVINDYQVIKSIELNKYTYYEFANGQETEFIKECLIKQLNIPGDNIKIFLVEKEQL